MNKYILKMKTPTGLGTEFIYVYSKDNLERLLLEKNIKYVRDITKDYQLEEQNTTQQQTIKELQERLDKIKELIQYENSIRDYDVAMGTTRLSKEELKDNILQIIES